MLFQALAWGATVAVLALSAHMIREARLMRSLYKHPKHMEKVD